jgi:catechol 2,3-dioxygenase-like lactoylglutathione lyase family enzyme
MFKIQTTQHVLAVKDLDDSEKYFVEKLGFDVRFRVEGWVFLSLQDFHVMIGHCADDLSAAETNNHSYFAYVNCVGIDDLFEQYKARHVEFTHEVTDKPWGLREFGVRTPEGHRILFGEEIDQSSS